MMMRRTIRKMKMRNFKYNLLLVGIDIQEVAIEMNFTLMNLIRRISKFTMIEMIYCITRRKVMIHKFITGMIMSTKMPDIAITESFILVGRRRM